MTLYPESDFTAPRADCPHPQRWTAPDAHSTECEVTELVAAFVRALQPDYVVETGTCWGATAEAIGGALALNGQGHLVSLEIDAGKVAYSRERCAGLPVDVLQYRARDFEPSYEIGFAFFDSDLAERLAEFEHFLPWLPAGATVAFHDTSPHMGLLGAALERHPNLRAMRLRTPRGITFAEVVK